MPPRCSTCGTHVAKPIGAAAFCNDDCSAAYDRALLRHPLRVDDKVRVPADSYAAAVCRACPALVHEDCTDIEQVRAASGHYLLPQAVADPITAWVERIGADVNRLPGEPYARYLFRRAHGITDTRERQRLAREARLSAAGTVTPSDVRKRSALAEEERAAKRFTAATHLPPYSMFSEAEQAQAEQMRQLVVQKPPADVILRIISDFQPAQLAAVARMNKHYARVIDLNGLLLRYCKPKYVVQRTARAIFEEDLAVFRVCVRYIEESLVPLLPQIVSALHKGCTQLGLEHTPDYIVWDWVSGVLVSMPNTTAEISAEVLRITTHEEFRNESEHPEDVFSIALGLPPFYRDDDGGGLSMANDFSGTRTYFPRRVITNAELHLLGLEAVIRRRCRRALDWLYRRRGGAGLSFTETCVYNLNNVRSNTTFVMPAGVPQGDALRNELADTQFGYFFPLEFGDVLRMWHALAAESRASLQQLGFCMTNDETHPFVSDFTVTVADALAPMFCETVPLDVLCSWIIAGVSDELQDIWTAPVFKWVRAKPDAVSILSQLAALRVRVTQFREENAESALLFGRRVREEVFAAVSESAPATPSPPLAPAGKRAPAPLDPWKVAQAATLASFKAMLLAQPSSQHTAAHALEYLADTICGHSLPRSTCMEALYFALIHLGRQPATMFEKEGLALVSLMNAVPEEELQQIFYAGLAPVVHIINSLDDGVRVNLSRIAADMTAYHLFDARSLHSAFNSRFAQHVGPVPLASDLRVIVAPRSPNPRDVSYMYDPVGEIADTLQIFSMQHGCSAFVSFAAGAINRMSLTDETPWVFLGDLGYALQRMLIVFPSAQIQNLEFHYELASLALRIVALEWLVFDYALLPSVNLFIFGALLNGIMAGLRNPAHPLVPELVFTRWTEISRAHAAVDDVTEPLWRVLNTAQRNSRLKATDPHAYKLAVDNAWAQLKQAKQQLNPPFLTTISHKLVLLLAALPRPASRNEEPAFSMLTIPAEDIAIPAAAAAAAIPAGAIDIPSASAAAAAAAAMPAEAIDIPSASAAAAAAAAIPLVMPAEAIDIPSAAPPPLPAAYEAESAAGAQDVDLSAATDRPMGRRYQTSK